MQNAKLLVKLRDSELASLKNKTGTLKGKEKDPKESASEKEIALNAEVLSTTLFFARTSSDRVHLLDKELFRLRPYVRNSTLPPRKRSMRCSSLKCAIAFVSLSRSLRMKSHSTHARYPRCSATSLRCVVVLPASIAQALTYLDVS